MERVPFWRCRKLSLIVPLYGLDLWRLQTEFSSGIPHLGNHAASNEAYCDGSDNSSAVRGMEAQLP